MICQSPNTGFCGQCGTPLTAASQPYPIKVRRLYSAFWGKDLAWPCGTSPPAHVLPAGSFGTDRLASQPLGAPGSWPPAPWAVLVARATLTPRPTSTRSCLSLGINPALGMLAGVLFGVADLAEKMLTNNIYGSALGDYGLAWATSLPTPA